MQSNNKGIVPISPGVDLIPSQAERLLNDYQHDPDIKLVEDNIKKVLSEMENQAAELANLADQSQQPRAYEVLHNFYKVMLEANRDLISTKLKKQEIEAGDRTKNPQGTITNNNLFVGSTAELQRFLIKKQGDNDGS